MKYYDDRDFLCMKIHANDNWEIGTEQWFTFHWDNWTKHHDEIMGWNNGA